MLMDFDADGCLWMLVDVDGCLQRLQRLQWQTSIYKIDQYSSCQIGHVSHAIERLSLILRCFE